MEGPYVFVQVLSANCPNFSLAVQQRISLFEIHELRNSNTSKQSLLMAYQTHVLIVTKKNLERPNLFVF